MKENKIFFLEEINQQIIHIQTEIHTIRDKINILKQDIYKKEVEISNIITDNLQSRINKEEQDKLSALKQQYTQLQSDCFKTETELSYILTKLEEIELQKSILKRKE